MGWNACMNVACCVFVRVLYKSIPNRLIRIDFESNIESNRIEELQHLKPTLLS